jgi:hypothetical protein
MEKEGKIIELNKYKSRIELSPLLSGDTVEIKDYTNSFSQPATSLQQPIAPPPPAPEIKKETVITPSEPKKVIIPKEPVNNDFNFDNNFNANTKAPDSEFMPPPEMDDNIDSAMFGEQSKQPEAETEEMPKAMAEQSAMMMISMYSMMVPPLIHSMVKNDIGEFHKVLTANPQVSDTEIQKLEKFLQSNNAEIEKALQLTKEQVQLLKQALAAVIRHYKVEPKNPIVNLLIVVIGIAVSQFMAIRQIMAAQNEQLAIFITKLNVKVPDDVEVKKKTRIIIRKSNLKQAA